MFSIDRMYCQCQRTFSSTQSFLFVVIFVIHHHLKSFYEQQLSGFEWKNFCSEKQIWICKRKEMLMELQLL